MKCALIGCGYWGGLFLDYIQADSFFELEQVCDSKTNLEYVWENDEIEAVFIMVPNEFHYTIAKEALLRGKHVFCEKPLTLLKDEAIELKTIAETVDTVIVTDFIYTFSKGLQMIKQWINEGQIGELQAIDFTTKHLGRFFGGDVYTLLGTHFLAVLDMFYDLNDLTHAKLNLVETKGGIPESGLLLSFDSNTFMSKIEVSLNYPEKTTYITFYGDKGTIIYNPRIEDSIKLCKYTKEKWVLPHKLKHNECNILKIDESQNIKYAIKYFADCIVGLQESNIDRAIKVTKVLESIL